MNYVEPHNVCTTAYVVTFVKRRRNSLGVYAE